MFIRNHFYDRCIFALVRLNPDDAPGPLLFLSNLFFFQFGIFPLDNGCNPEYVKCAFGVANVVPCDIGLVYQGSAHACNYPDLLIQELSCDPSALLGGFVCPNPQELQGKEFYRPELFELTRQ